MNILQNITINQEYTLYFYATLSQSLKSNDTNDTLTYIVPDTGNSSWATLAISKNGASFVAPTNNSVEIGNGWYSITFTAAEMNNDTILFSYQGNHTNFTGTNEYSSNSDAIMILTTTSANAPIASSTTLPNISTFTSFSNPTAQEVLSVLWQSMTTEASKKGWDFATFLKKWTF